MIKNLVLLIMLSTTFISYGQIIMEQIGKSIVVKTNRIIGDSMITYKADYDQKSRIKKEWRISRNDSGRITDTNWCNFDTMRNITYFYYGGDYDSYYKFDNSGNVIEYKIRTPNYKSVMFYKSEYDMEGKIIHQTGSTDEGPFAGTDEINYYYHNDTIIERHGDHLTNKTVKNKFNRVIFSESIAHTDTIKTQNSYTQEFDSKGNLLKYTRIENEVVTKITTHYYKDGLEYYMIEEFLDNDYRIITHFKYHYW